MGFELDLNFDAGEAQALEAGGVHQPGWYRCTVHDVADEAEKGFWEFHYRVTAGPWAGGTIKDRLWKPESAADTEKAQTSTNRVKLVFKRLGVWDGTPGRKELSLADCIGKECWLKLSERSYKTSDGRPATAVNVEWSGIYPLDDERVPAEVRNPGSAGSTSARGTGARRTAGVIVPPPPPKPKPDYSDL